MGIQIVGQRHADARTAGIARWLFETVRPVSVTQRELSGPNLKANEFLNRRLTVEDAADAHGGSRDNAGNRVLAETAARRIFSCPQSRPTSEKPRNLFMDP